MDTDYFCKFLEQNRISDDAIAVFRKENVSGTVFPDLAEGDLKDMGLKMGDRKLLLQLQGKHIPKRTQVSHAHSASIIILTLNGLISITCQKHIMYNH